MDTHTLLSYTCNNIKMYPSGLNVIYMLIIDLFVRRKEEKDRNGGGTK